MKNKNKGISILGILFWGFIIILILGYFNISVRSVVESEKTQESLDYVGENTKSVWDKYLKDPATYLWQDIWLDIFWDGFVSNMERIRDGKPTDLDQSAENIQVR